MSKSADLLKAGKKMYPSFDFEHYNLESVRWIDSKLFLRVHM